MACKRGERLKDGVGFVSPLPLCYNFFPNVRVAPLDFFAPFCVP